VDLLGERLADRASECSAGGAGSVVVERERGVEVLRGDMSFAVGESLDEREPDVRLVPWRSCGGRLRAAGAGSGTQ
jgi:hypothetical protein